MLKFFNGNFNLVSTTHSYNTRSARNGRLFVPSYNTVRFGKKSIIHSTTLTWNYLQDKLTEYNFLYLTPKNLKTAELESNEPAVMIIYYEYESLYNIYT